MENNSGIKETYVYRRNHIIHLVKTIVYSKVVSKVNKISTFILLGFLLSPFLTLAQFHPDSVLVPAACYNFVNDLENDNGLTGINPLEPNPPSDTATFIDAEELCLNNNNKHYQMTSGQGLDVDNGSLTSIDNYTVELLFKVDDIPADNDEGRVFIMNFSNQNKAGIFINPDGYICYYTGQGSNGTEEACGTDLVSPDYPNDFPTEWINLAISYDNNEIVVYLNGEEQFRVEGDNEFNLQNQTSYFVPSSSLSDNPVADITIDYIRYFDEVLDATSIESLNLAAIAGNDIEIQASATEGCIGEDITLTAAGGDRSFYVWSTGDTTENENLTYTIFQASDTLWVQGVAVSPCERQCFDIADTIVITGFPNPEMGIVGPTELCEGDLATFSASEDPAGGMIEYFWSTTGSTSSETGADTKDYSVIYDANGVFDLNLEIENEYGCIADTTIQITVNNVPTPGVNLPASACEFQNVNIEYTGNATDSAIFTWDWDGGTVENINDPGRNFDVSWDSLGTKTIRYEIEEGNCLVVDSVTIDITRRPTLDYSAPDSVCATNPVNIDYLGNADTSIANITWDFGDGVNSGDNINAEVVWDNPGTKTIILSIDEGGCINDSTFFIEVLPVPTTEVDFPTDICAGQPATFEYIGTADASADLVWSLDGGTVSNVITTDREFDVTWDSLSLGSKEITLNISQNGCDTDTTFYINVGKTPTADFDLPAGACTDEDVVVLYTGTANLNLNSPELEFTWDWGVDGSATPITTGGQEAYNVQWSSFGTKTVKLQVTENGCTSTELTQTIEIAEKPVIDFDPNTSICVTETTSFVFTGNDAGGDFTWDFDGGTQVSINDANTDFELEWDSAGTKNVVVSIDNNGCITTETYTIDVLEPATTAVSYPAFACAGQAARFVYEGSGDTNDAGTTFNWTFEDADNVDPLGDEVYDVTWDTYDAANTTKTITLEINKNGCTVIRDFTIEISPMPVPEITAPTEACMDETVSVTFDSDIAGATLDGYDFGTDGVEAATADPEVWNVAWSSIGTKTISATYSINGCDSTVTQDIEIFPIPSDDMDTETQICDNATANFTYMGNASNTVSWTMPTGVTYTQVSGNDRDIEITFPVTGTSATYTIEAEISNGNCEILFSEDVTVLPAPISNIPNLGTICTTEPVTVDLTSIYDANNSYSWIWNGAIVDNYNGAGIWTVYWPTSGTKTIELTVQSPNGCQAIDTQTLNVGYLPQLGDLDVPESVCENQSFEIAYLGNAAEVTNFDWTEQAGGTFNFDGTDSWTVEFDSPGEKEVSLQMIGGAGCTVDTTFTINVNFYPDFGLSSNNTCTNIAVFVTYPDVLTVDIDTTWNFGDSAIFEQINDTTFSVEYNTPGEKTISLTIDGDCGVDVQTATVDVSAGPEYTVDAEEKVCINDPNPYEIELVESTDTDVEIIGFRLVPNDDNATGIISADGLSLFVEGWDYGGYKQAILEVRDVSGNGCPNNTETIDYAVYNFIELNAFPANGCIGETINISFSGVVEDGATFNWKFDGAIVNEIVKNEEYELRWDNSGPKLIELEIVGQCNTISDSLAINIGDPANTSLDFDSNVCEGEAANITYDMSLLTTNSTVNGVDIIYGNMPNDTTNDEPENGVFAPVWNTAGVKNFSLIVNNGGCIDTADYQITVYQFPVASFTRSDNRVCVGEAVDFNFNGSLPTGTNVDWGFQEDDAADITENTTDTNYSVFWQTPGTKTITLDLDNGGCTDSFTREIEVLPYPDFEIDMPDDVCRNAPVRVGLINNGTGTISDFDFEWIIDNAVTVVDLGNEEYELTFPDVSTQTITVNITGTGGCNNSISDDIIVNPAPNLVYTATPNPLCVGDDFTFEYTGVAGTDFTGGIDVNLIDSDGGIEDVAASTNRESVISWSTPGFKRIRVEVEDDNNCPAVAVVDVEVLPLPTMTYDAPTDFCIGEEFIVTYTGSADPFTDDFIWTFDPANLDYATKVAGQQAYRVRYTAGGAKTIEISVINSNECENTVSFDVNIVQGPTDFNVDQGPVCAFDELTFYLGGNEVVNIDPGVDGSWDISDPNNITWSTPGTKTVALTLTNGSCDIVREFDVVVKPTPLGEITVDVGCVGQPTLVSYGGEGAAGIFAEYYWGTSFDDAASYSKLAGQEAYEVIWDTPGTYLISVDIIGENGCENTILLPEITINPSPTVNFRLPATICEFVERELTVNDPDSSYQYTWNLGPYGEIVSSNADSTQITAVWEDIGSTNVNTDVSVTATLNGCSTTRTRTIRVLLGPDPTFDAPLFCLDETTGVAVGTITYEGDNDLDNDTFEWDFDLDSAAGETAVRDTPPANSQNYIVTYKTPGRKAVTLTVTNANCGSRSFTDFIAVNNLAEFEFSSANDSLCEGASTRVWFTGEAEENATYDWDFDLDLEAGDEVDEIVTDSLFEITYNSTGPKTIRLEITGETCNDDDFERTFIIGEQPTSDFELGADENCLGDLTKITYTGTTSDGGFLNWDWVDGIPTQLNDSTFEVRWPTGGLKELSLVVEDGGCISDTTFQTLMVYDNSASNLLIDTNLCVDSLGMASVNPEFFDPGATWSWDFQGVDVIDSNTDSTEITFSYDSIGEKFVNFSIDGSLCNDFDSTFVINVGAPIPFSISADTEICSNDSARIVFTLPMVNGRELEWDFDNPSQVTKISNTREDYFVTWDTVGIKNVTVYINNKGCIADSTFQVNVKQLPDATFQTDDFMCQDDILKLVPDWDISPLSIIRWSYNYNGEIGTQNEADFELLLDTAGTIEISLSVLEDGCQDFYTTTIDILEKPAASINAPDFICLEGTANISFGDSLISGTNYDWGFDGATTVNDLGNETYELGWSEGGDKTLYVVASKDGCPSDTAFHTLNVFSLDNLEVESDTICQHELAVVNFVDEGLDISDYTWDFDGAEIISGSGFGPYELFWNSAGEKEVSINIDGFICNTDQLSKVITVVPSSFPTIDISISDLVCRNTDVSVELDMDNQGDNPEFEWFINGESIGSEFDSTLLSDQDIIKVKLISGAECVIENEVMSNEVTANILDYQYTGNTIANPNPVCIGDSVVVSLDPGNYNVLDWEVSTDLDNWTSLGVSSAELVDFPEEDTYYRANIIDVQGLCPQTTPPATARVVPYNPIDAGNDISIREGDTRILEATDGQSFVWRNDVSIESDVRNSRIQVSPVITTTYFVDGLTINGCPDVDSVTVVVRPPVEPPNVFSPNGDSFNDVWQLDQINQYPNAEVKIYNRWGKELFYSIGYDEPWDGRFNGEVLAPGVYYYVIDLKDGYDAVTGTITILY
ncbi:PKD domain-containing protein [Marivirga salinae]|uniref:PKD domain-containing protein n=1 Tax=Marivirga salinarum TaxID=3059078 RepID=A0AA51NB03_9BACT|nr:PKD domain-containing protein [Marivirga sp. BDSF4-3]WMN11974.1 PKD domain-containing protein [Marivirga sp. BDSF4-3]